MNLKQNLIQKTNLFFNSDKNLKPKFFELKKRIEEIEKEYHYYNTILFELLDSKYDVQY